MTDQNATHIPWDIVLDLDLWLRQANGDGHHQTAMQIMKISEELGEYEAAVSPQEKADELCDVALTALVALAGWVAHPDLFYRDSLNRPLLSLVCATGEASAAYIGYVGQNPRKGKTCTWTDICYALCDVARAAFAELDDSDPAVFAKHVRKVADRAGVTTPESGHHKESGSGGTHT